MEWFLPTAELAYFLAANGSAAFIGGLCLGALHELPSREDWGAAALALVLGTVATGFATAVFWLPALTALPVWSWLTALVISIVAWLGPLLWLGVVIPIKEHRQLKAARMSSR